MTAHLFLNGVISVLIGLVLLWLVCFAAFSAYMVILESMRSARRELGSLSDFR